MKLFVLDTHTIYRRGLVACLDLLEEVESVADAERVRDAWEHPALFAADIVLIDPALPGGSDFVGAVREATGARVIVCSSDSGQDAALARAAGGCGGLPAQGRADAGDARHGGQGGRQRHRRRHARTCSSTCSRSCPRTARRAAARPVAAKLTDREQQVLALIAAGHPTREVAQELCYSERTVKNVLHDVVTKLNARSRSQAVAFAVREGLI